MACALSRKVSEPKGALRSDTQRRERLTLSLRRLCATEYAGTLCTSHMSIETKGPYEPLPARQDVYLSSSITQGLAQPEQLSSLK